MASIQASEKPILKVLCDDYVLRVPVYQRPYAWESEHVEKLVDDLLYALGGGDDELYFLGSVVLIRSAGDDPLCDVVDGQQRLTTLTMILCVLRELIGGEWARGLDNRIRQQSDVAAGREEILRLQLRERDQDFFHKFVQHPGGINDLPKARPRTDSQARIKENVSYLRKEIGTWDKKQRTDLAAFIVRRLYLVVVTVDNPSSAYRIFSVMNDRGLDLSPTDILKAEIMGGIDCQSRDAYAGRWETVEERLGRSRFVELFSHIRMIYAKDKQRHTLQDEIKDKVLQSSSGKDFIDDVLVPYAEAYEKVLCLDDEIPSKARPYLEYLSRLDSVDWIPPVMKAFVDHPSEKALVKFVRKMERLAYGLFILRANINERIARFATVIKEIEEEQGHVFEVMELRDTEKTSIVNTLDGPVYELGRVRKPLLLRLDGLLAEAGASYEHSTITIEHVLPQHPKDGSQWMDWFPDEQERKDWKHRIANLVLLSRRKNAQASNLEFERKKREYFSREGVTPFSLTTSVLGKGKWTPKVLEKRQEDLLERLKEEWSLR